MRALRSCVLLSLALAACERSQAPLPGAAGASGTAETLGGGPPGGTVIVLADREPDELNPLTFDSNPAYQVVHLVFRALARRDSTLAGYAPDLLASWRLRPDSVVELRVRPGLRWHDGRPVRAEDVAFTIERQQDPRTASPRRNDVLPVLQVRVVDSLTLEVRLVPAGRYTLNALLELVPVPKHLLDSVPPDRLKFSAFGRRPVGNGLYRFVRWRPGQEIVLVRDTANPPPRAAIATLVLRFVPDASAALTELLAGQGDLLKVPPDQVARVQASATARLVQAPRVRPAWIAWNADRFPVNDRRVRRALLMGIDRSRLARGLFGGLGEPALSPLPAALWEHSPGIRPLPYDPARAAALLDSAGWRDTDGDGLRDKDGRPLRLEVEYNSSDPVRRDVLVAIQSQLRRLGVEIVPRAYESTTWVTRLRQREFVGSFWGWGWGPGVVGPNAIMVFHSRSVPPGGPNFAGFRDPRVDAILDSVLVVADSAVLRRLWREFEQRVVDDPVYAPIYLDPELFGVHGRIANVKMRGIEWWEDVPFWYIPPERRLPRDRALSARSLPTGGRSDVRPAWAAGRAAGRGGG